MSAGHVLVVGGFPDINQKLLDEQARITLLVRADRLHRYPSLTGYQRVLVFQPEATEQELLDILDSIALHDPFDHLGCFNEWTEFLAARIARHFGLSFHSPDALQAVHNKHHMRQKLREAGLEDVRSIVVDNPNLFSEMALKLGFPLVVKPLDGQASMGVTVVTNAEQLDHALHWFKQGAAGKTLLLEEYLDGTEYSVEGFSENGIHKIICVTQKFKESMHCVELGHCLPASLPSDVHQQILQHVSQVLSALQIQNGPSHTEVIVGPQGPRVVETHTRLGGDHIRRLVELTYGINLEHMWARQALGQPVLHEIPDEPQHAACAAVWFLTTNSAGRITSLEAPSWKGQSNIDQVILIKKTGDVIEGLKDSTSRLACTISTGDTLEEALQHARQTCGLVQFKLTEAEVRSTT